MWSPLIILRADEYKIGWCRIRAELWQKTKFQKIGRTERKGPRVRSVRQGGHRFRFRSQISSSDVYMFLQSHGVRKLYGLLSG